jgi:hypothetical protein
LDAVDLGKLTAYKRRQDYYHETYGESIWALQYQTDVRTRTEQFVRVKRELLAQYNKDWQSSLTQADNDEDKATVIFRTMKNPYVPTRPWDSVFGRVNADKDWWREQLEYTLFRSHGSSVTSAIDGDVPVARAQVGAVKRAAPGGDASGNSAGQVINPPQPPPRPPRTTEPPAKKAKKPKGQHNVENGYHTTSRDGTPLCIRFNLGQCQSTKGLSCPADSSRYHLCSKCLRPGHGANACQQEVREPTSRKSKKGGGKGGKPP